MCTKIYNQQNLNKNKNKHWFYYFVGLLKFIFVLLNMIASTYSRIYMYFFLQSREKMIYLHNGFTQL